MVRTPYKLLGPVVCLLFVDVLVAAPAFAVTPEDLAQCSGKTNVAPKLRVSACTEIIESDIFSGKDLAAVFNNRGLLYQMSGDYVRSIADFDQAIRLDPDLALDV